MCGGPDKPDVTEQEKVAAQTAKKKWEMQERYFTPIEDQFRANVSAQNHDAYKGDVVRSASAGVQTQNAQQVTGGVRRMVTGGVDPTGSRFDASSKALQRASALNESNVSTNAMIDSEINAQRGNQAVVALGQGQEAGALQSFSNMANTAHRAEASQSIDNFNNSNDQLNAAAGIAGMAAPYAVKNSRNSVVGYDGQAQVQGRSATINDYSTTA